MPEASFLLLYYSPFLSIVYKFFLCYYKTIIYKEKSHMRTDLFKKGIRDGIPIGLGYLAVSFSLGITAKTAGLNPFQGFLSSLLENASAGEYILFTLIGAGASYIEVFVMTLIANARYLLMSCALSQHFSPDTPWYHRIFVGFDLTDELFGIAISRPDYLEPVYMYGAFLMALPAWSVGTALGIIAGNLLPADVVSALSVALFGMFIAIIIPPAKKDRIILALIIISFILSFIFNFAPYISSVSSGTRTIILTLLIAGGAALLFPVKDEHTEAENEA
jgi:predicted branched-subunit amino acid permease